MKHVLVFTLLLVSAVGLAQTASPVPALPQVDSLSKWLEEHMMAMVAGLGVALHIVASLWPTSKPQNLFIWLSAALEALQKLLKVLSDLSDKLLQNVKK